MRNLVILLSLICSLSLGAQQAEPVYGHAQVRQTPEWYRSQVKAWRAVLKKDPNQHVAWYYIYYATRNAQRTDENDKRADSIKLKEMEQLVDEINRAVPDSYEANLVTWMHHGNDQNYLKHLNRAMELGPDRLEHIDYVINQAELSRDLAKRGEALIKKWKAGLLSPGMTNYNHNVLAGLKENSILLTAGDNDTYPAWFAQAQGFRKDVKVINLSLIMLDDYRERLFKELGISSKLAINWEAKSLDDPNHVKKFYKKLLSALISNTKGYTVNISLTSMGYKDLIDAHQDKLYLTGLAYEYSTEPLDERALLKKNFEQNYSLDYILHAYYLDLSVDLVPVINYNYLVPMLKLYDHYKLAGDRTRMDWLKRYLVAAAKGSGSEKEVQEHLD